MKYAIIGTGALGAFYGANLVTAGTEVHFLLRSDYETVAEKGLRVDSVNGNIFLPKVNYYNSSNKMPQCDIILVCLKTTQNHLLPKLLAPILHQNSLILLLQNGLGMEDDLAHQLPNAKIAGALAFIAASKIASGHFGHYAYGSLIFGDFTGGNQELLSRVSSDFRKANIPVTLTDNLMAARWQKLVWNIPFSGLSVVLNTTTDQLLANRNSRDLVHQLMHEAVAAANQCKANLPADLPAKLLQMTDKMAPYAPSMKLDFDAKRPMEIKYIYEKPIRTAEKCGFEMKMATMLAKQLQFLEKE